MELDEEQRTISNLNEKITAEIEIFRSKIAEAILNNKDDSYDMFHMEVDILEINLKSSISTYILEEIRMQIGNIEYEKQSMLTNMNEIFNKMKKFECLAKICLISMELGDLEIKEIKKV